MNGAETHWQEYHCRQQAKGDSEKVLRSNSRCFDQIRYQNSLEQARNWTAAYTASFEWRMNRVCEPNNAMSINTEKNIYSHFVSLTLVGSHCPNHNPLGTSPSRSNRLPRAEGE